MNNNEHSLSKETNESCTTRHQTLCVDSGIDTWQHTDLLKYMSSRIVVDLKQLCGSSSVAKRTDQTVHCGMRVPHVYRWFSDSLHGVCSIR